MTDLLICSYLDPDHVERVRAVSDRVAVHYHPELIGTPRYEADHTARLERSAEQRRRWTELLGRAEICFDFDYSDLEGFKEHTGRLAWVQASSAGIGQFVRRHGLELPGVTLTTAAGVHARPLAEFVLFGVLAFAKNYPLARAQQRQRVWRRFHNDDLEGKTLAVVGLGSIGREVARMARGVGMRVIGSKRTVAGLEPADLGVDALHAQSDLPALLAEADYLCLVAPHTPETEGMIDADAFAAMKPGSVLVNIGRGALVDEAALLAALRDGPIAGAVLDVAPQEPLPPEHPLWEMENVILFPHSASTSKQENRRLTELFVDNLRRWLAGEPLRNRYEPDRLY